jgi:hypothetical protein
MEAEEHCDTGREVEDCKMETREHCSAPANY